MGQVVPAEMMSAGADALGLAALVFVLGLKHGLDPDHLVAIDGLTRSSRSRWCGLFFSLGHGCVVTLVGIALAVVASDWQVPRGLARHERRDRAPVSRAGDVRLRKISAARAC